RRPRQTSGRTGGRAASGKSMSGVILSINGRTRRARSLSTMNTTLTTTPAGHQAVPLFPATECVAAFLNGLFRLRRVGSSPAPLVPTELTVLADRRAGEGKVRKEQPGRRPWHN